jgi:hypothetical protein
LIDRGLVHVPPIEVLPLEEAALGHRMIDTGHVRGKLVLKVAAFGLSTWLEDSSVGSSKRTANVVWMSPTAPRTASRR